MNTKTKLALLRTLRDRKQSTKGFTLIELMITVAIVGILAAVALPRFLGARDSAEAGAAVGAMLGGVKECAVLSNSGVGQQPTLDTDQYTMTGCQSSAGSTTSATTKTWNDGVVGVKCLTSTSVLGNTSATAEINENGVLSCYFNGTAST